MRSPHLTRPASMVISDDAQCGSRKAACAFLLRQENTSCHVVYARNERSTCTSREVFHIEYGRTRCTFHQCSLTIRAGYPGARASCSRRAVEDTIPSLP